MTTISRIRLCKPYLILVGDESDATFAKTALGIVQWRPQDVAGQLRFSDTAVDLGVPDVTLQSAAAQGIGSLVIGVAPVGGVIPDTWWQVILEAAEAGLDIVNGLHTHLTGNAHVVAAANESGARLIDVRIPPDSLPVGNGRKRSGRRILTVGTDCAIGKKYSALALHAAFVAAGLKSTFRATGQTGIMIAGEGIPIDAVIADFIAGAAEVLSPDNDPHHWDVIEGQGSLLHPAYSGVSLGLLHGSQPDGIVVCHDPARESMFGWEHYAIPSLQETISLHETVARRTNPDARCVGICVNTSSLAVDERTTFLKSLHDRYQVPAVDPLVDGCADIVAFVRNLI